MLLRGVASTLFKSEVISKRVAAQREAVCIGDGFEVVSDDGSQV